ncbi:MAG: hypothetical protein K2X39_06460, partial [Silvanigrellaceae bacterium]|nr:hypothetical protein [Silvanigrellaceae bacterium]
LLLDQTFHFVEPDQIPDYKRKNVKVAGLVTIAKEKRNKDGAKFLVIKIEDSTGELELTLFSKQYAALSPETIKIGTAVWVECKLKKGIEEGSVKGVIQSIGKISDKRAEMVKQITIHATEDFIKKSENISKLNNIFKKFSGKTPVNFEVQILSKQLKLQAKFAHCAVTPSDEMIFAIENSWPGEVFVQRNYQLIEMI